MHQLVILKPLYVISPRNNPRCALIEWNFEKLFEYSLLYPHNQTKNDFLHFN